MRKIKILLIILFSICVASTTYASDDMYVMQKDGNNVYEVFLDKNITEPEAYRKLILYLNYATEQDTFIFHVNTNGGNLFSALEIYSAIKNTKADTIADIYRAYSAGAVVALACKKIIINDFATMMIHNGTQSMGGDLLELRESSIFFKKFNDDILEILFYDFLDMEEIESIENGKLLWLDEDQLFIRFTKMKKIFKN